MTKFNVSFLTPEHKQRFKTIMGRFGMVERDSTYSMALYILTANARTWEIAEPHVKSGRVNFEAIPNELHGSVDSVLFRLAGNLFNGSQHVDPLELVLLDENDYRLTLMALELRRYLHIVCEMQ